VQKAKEKNLISQDQLKERTDGQNVGVTSPGVSPASYKKHFWKLFYPSCITWDIA
jgi:hypothetical protein